MTPSSGRPAASSSVGGRAHGVGVAEAEPHEAPLGLVGDGVAAQLGDDRVAELVGGGDGLVGGRRPAARRAPARRGRRAAPSTRPRTACGIRVRVTVRGRAPAACPSPGSSRGSTGGRGRWDERLAVAAECAGWGMTDYVYAPKDDPKHRARVAGARTTTTSWTASPRSPPAGTLRLGFGISPGLSIDAASDADRAALAAKVDQVVDAGAGLVVLCLDDIPFGGAEQGARPRPAGDLARWPHLGDRADARPGAHRVRRASAARPTSTPSAAALPRRRADRLDRRRRRQRRRSPPAQARRRAEAARRPAAARLGQHPGQRRADGRPAAPRAAVGPRRRPARRRACRGWLANPMVQADGVAAPAGVDRRVAAGRGPARRVGRRGRPAGLAGLRRGLRRRRAPRARRRSPSRPSPPASCGATTSTPLRTWFAEAAERRRRPASTTSAPAWIEQVRAEASVALAALDAARRRAARRRSPTAAPSIDRRRRRPSSSASGGRPC